MTTDLTFEGMKTKKIHHSNFQLLKVQTWTLYLANSPFKNGEREKRLSQKKGKLDFITSTHTTKECQKETPKIKGSNITWRPGAS